MKDKLDKEKVIEFTSYCIKNYDRINGLDSVFESFFAEKPLFTTFDGVEIFEGDRAYILTKSFTLGVAMNYEKEDFKKSTSLFFAKKENAEKYIRDNQINIISLKTEPHALHDLYYDRNICNQWIDFITTILYENNKI